MYEIVGFGATKNTVFLRCFLRSNRLLIICIKLGFLGVPYLLCINQQYFLLHNAETENT